MRNVLMAVAAVLVGACELYEEPATGRDGAVDACLSSADGQCVEPASACVADDQRAVECSILCETMTCDGIDEPPTRAYAACVQDCRGQLMTGKRAYCP